jgi:hypothetical protein
LKASSSSGTGYGTSRVAVTSPLTLVLQIVALLLATQEQLGTPPHAAGRALQA